MAVQDGWFAFLRRIPQGQHAFVAVDGAHNPGQTERQTGIVEQIAGFDGIGTIEHQIAIRQQRCSIAGFEKFCNCFGADIRELIPDAFSRNHRLVFPDIIVSENHLPVEVAFLHAVAVYDADESNAGRGQIKQGRATESAHADNRHAR